MNTIKKTTTYLNTAGPTTFEEMAPNGINELIFSPPSNSEAVAIQDFKQFTIDTSSGDITGDGHGVGDFRYLVLKGGGNISQSFARETRVTTKDGTASNEIISHTHVFESDGETSGSITTYLLDNLPDWSGMVSWVSRFMNRYLDPRHIFVTKGGIVPSAKPIGTSTYTLTLNDSMRTLPVMCGTACTVTLDAEAIVTPGFRCWLQQFDSSQISISVSSPCILYNIDGHTKSGGQYSEICISVASAGVVVLSGKTGS